MICLDNKIFQLVEKKREFLQVVKKKFLIKHQNFINKFAGLVSKPSRKMEEEETSQSGRRPHILEIPNDFFPLSVQLFRPSLRFTFELFYQIVFVLFKKPAHFTEP